MISAVEALSRLREGNRRFVTDERRPYAFVNPARRREVATGQEPFAIILGCSDSRVPSEIVFDQGLGDLFSVRVAGNIVAPSQIGSVEFAASQFGTRLVVVLGHSQCGAVQATLNELRTPKMRQTGHIGAIVDRIIPSVKPLLEQDAVRDEELLLQTAIRANVQVSVNQLKHGSDVLERLLVHEGLLVIGAEYSLETGEVLFLDD